MSKFRKRHPALKHGGYSSTAVLPGENQAEFEELHQALIAELAPTGALEENIVADIVRLVWRRQNLAIRLVEIDDTATVQGLLRDLEIEERLGAVIDKCLKRLLFVRGPKSLSTASSSAPLQPVPGDDSKPEESCVRE